MTNQTDVPSAFSVAGKVAVVTGAGSRADGIGNGRAASVLLARHGAKVALIDTNRDWVAATAAMIAEEGGTARSWVCDVTDAAACKVPAGPRFVRGDGNSDGSINLTDGVIPLLYLFSGGDAPACVDAADTNDTGAIEITDAIIIFSWLFSGGAAPASPSPTSAGYLRTDCGEDLTADGLGCASEAVLCE